MKCLNCGQENKDTVRACKKCDRDLTLPPAWFPDWRWHVRTLAAIYALLIVAFFTAKWLLRRLPPPYDIRDVPPEMTPWLKSRTPHDPALAPKDTPEVSPLAKPAPTAAPVQGAAPSTGATSTAPDKPPKPQKKP